MILLKAESFVQLTAEGKVRDPKHDIDLMHFYWPGMEWSCVKELQESQKALRL